MTDVLHVVTLLSGDGRYGGPQVVARSVAGHFGHQVWGCATAADLAAEPERPGECRFLAARWTSGRLSTIFAPRLPAALWRLLGSQARPGLVHVHTGPELAGLAALVVLVLRRAAFVVQPHGMFTYPPDSPRARVVRRVLVPLIRRAAAVIALTDAEREVLLGYGLSPERVHVVPNGIDPSAVPPRPQLSDPVPTVAFVGRLHPRKHPERFAGAAALLSEQGVRARFVMAGADQGALAAAREADPHGAVDYLGSLPSGAARQVIAAADVLVMCSDVEPFGLVAIEALAAGTALLVTDSCDLAGELDAAGAALVTAPTPAAIAAGLRRLLEDPELRARQRAAGEDLVKTRYDMDVVAAVWADLYGRAAASPTS
jgi:glycosyltransferase involved in cell wall biosynthesis